MSITEVKVPDIGDFESVEIIEVICKKGDTVSVEDPLISVESDKATMDVPSPIAGVIREIKVKVGEKVSAGSLILKMETTDVSTENEEEINIEKDESEDKSLATESDTTPVKTFAGKADMSCDVLVLGSGPGGYTAAFRAADLGLNVLLVERYNRIGGVCLNVGCIPSKTLLHAAKVIDETESMSAHGVSFGKPKINLEQLREWKNGIVNQLTSGLKSMAKQRKVQIVTGVGEFLDQNHLCVTDTENKKLTLHFENAIIAVGSQPVKLPFLPEDSRIVDSTGSLELTDIPEHMLVIGGGIIGLEMATVYHALGSKISVVEMLDGLMAGADRDIVRPFQKRISKQYENIWLETKVTKVEALKNGLKVHFEGKNAPEKPQMFDQILSSVGRIPNGLKIAAEKAGVVVDKGGFIKTDSQMRTNMSHIFAIGDLVGQPMLAHKATHEAKVAAEVISGMKSYFDARTIPSVAYTDPEVAWAGITEEEAKKEGVAYGKGNFPWAASGRSLSLGRSEGMTKVLFEEGTNRVIGVGIVGPNAGDLIAEGVLAIEMGCDATDLGSTIHPHPTLSETVGFAAEAFEGTITDLYLPKKKKNNS
ncbi:MAG: dihydrolipoyl dehydrogenase [SAR324 cluster bacterium]|mgnify:FL=1|jgi:dihydrolipoamide dehydrogenase|nr:dihydrolipoyl dehydrogenase [SAR324 cluster bacterium]MCH2265535.1 dihydrolipoyl dehydrogenase [SAR324 cluster bacterium]